MTNKQLIKALQKLPKNLKVAFKDHDQGNFEINNYIRAIEVVDFTKNKSEPDQYNQHELRSGIMIILKP